METKFNVRVYGILINTQNQLLVADEKINDFSFTKFPGGGLEFGEGTIDCLKREFFEETHTHVEVVKHIYTTDFFQPSAFHSNHQLISIYYQVKLLEPLKFPISELPFQFKTGLLALRWIDINDLLPQHFTFPVDQHIVPLVKRLV
jgi:8-oxo-dGTP diphosphatase